MDPNAQGQGDLTPALPPSGLPGEHIIDLSLGPFLGGAPTSGIDLPVTSAFLILFIAGAVTHMGIFRTNKKRGHKFLLNLMAFQVCVLRIVTCAFRIAWIYSQLRGVVLVAQILQNAADILLYVLNSFLVQRIVRALHPRFGWHPVFQTLTLFFAFSAPVTIITNITSATVGYLKTEHQNVVLTAIEVLKSTSCWTLILAAYPLVAITLAGNTPGPRPEPFGTGSLRAKTALVLATAAPLTAGAAVRLAVGYVHVRPGSENAPGANPLFGRPVFYTTQFAVEVLVLALYAAARIDLRFHVPDGAAGPGDYAAGVIRPGRVGTKTVEEIQADIEAIGVPYQILGSSAATTAAAEEKGVAGRERLYAVLWANTRRAASRLDSITSSAAPELPELRTDAHPAEKSWFVLEAEDEEGGRF